MTSDPNTAPHYHLYDVQSGRLTDIASAEVRISGLPEVPEGMVTEGMDEVSIEEVNRATGI